AYSGSANDLCDGPSARQPTFVVMRFNVT
ncbi:MAG: hypothetical protein JWO70_3728, partial [Betaproteobacteria bacterium]|nr:hypothetical protein [Betaproteobacteria bacterium]